MRTELWGLRDKMTREPIYTYWASSNKYRALFAKKETAEDACRNPRNPNMEPFRITGDPIRAAGGCRCGECSWGQQDDPGVMHCHKHHIHKKSGGYCDDGEPREAQDDE